MKKIADYKLNEGVLSELKERGVTDEVLKKLMALQDIVYSSKSDFTRALVDSLEPDELQCYRSEIYRAAKVFQLRRIALYLESQIKTRFPPSHIRPGIVSYLLGHPLMLTLLLHSRWYWFSFVNKSEKGVDESRNENDAGFDHNRKQMLSFLEGHRLRTESLVNILCTIRELDVPKAKVLCPGPRNEAELLLLRLNGFKGKNLEAIDLFSYSPTITVMDMNDLQYADDSFDVYYSSAVIKYSPDIRKTVAESVRVTKPGGIMAYGFMFGVKSDLIPDGAELMGGVQELLELYEGYVEHVFWQEEFVFASDDIRATVIFKLKK